MNEEYIFTIDNSVIQYHASSKSFRIILYTYNDMCLTIDDINDYRGSNYYVLKRIPQSKTKMTIKLIKIDINEINIGDLIFTPLNGNIKITDLYKHDNYALILQNYKNDLDLVRVIGDDISVSKHASPNIIYKVIYVESNS